MTVPESTRETRLPQSADALRQWVARHVADQARLPHEEIRPDVPLAEYGLDSLYAVALAADLEDGLGLALEPTVALEHGTIGELVDFVLGELDKERADGV
ncbi:acyl carrier protein [Streptomyces sp. NBC_01363]|uniref:acyl carrier protein n=1 Tax=Streptomyces sp. NBC_01363 TaxID=2903840 RepID=UPI00225720DD|nr:acyl carrier protein [Streptomyces sp. NBC_01363]MCX4733347.1 acyl carrier protein [Streptomyces sp. NBC_01363]